MHFYDKLKQFTKESIHIMIVPHSGENIRQVKCKKMIFYSALSFISILCISLVFLVSSMIHLNHQLDVKLASLSKLESINNKQKVEISHFKNEVGSVSEKLSLLNELEIEVRDLVGLKKQKDEKSPSKPISRSIIREDLSKKEGVEVDLESLASEMDEETEELNDLIDEVTDQLKVLEAKPNQMPTYGKITSKFGYRISPTTGKRQFHKGLDIANGKGTKIIAAGTGVVTFSGWNSGYGKTIIISHGYGYRSVYAHNSMNLVKVGQKVKKGEVIGKIGTTGRSTGPHLHFEVHYQGKQIDPQKILNQ